VIQPRAADDFATIRARIEELRYVTRPRAAGDFPMIRSRMVELRREREQILAKQEKRLPLGPRPHSRSVRNETEDQPDRILPRSIGRSILRWKRHLRRSGIGVSGRPRRLIAADRLCGSSRVPVAPNVLRKDGRARTVGGTKASGQYSEPIRGKD
jgi:hypothetical protein